MIGFALVQMCSKRVFFPFNKHGTCLILKSDLIQVFNPLFSFTRFSAFLGATIAET